MLTKIELQNLILYQTYSTRHPTFRVLRENNYRAGLNCPSNKFHILNGKILLEWLNKPMTLFKIGCKRNSQQCNKE
jgi:hypothetical protein